MFIFHGIIISISILNEYLQAQWWRLFKLKITSATSRFFVYILRITNACLSFDYLYDIRLLTIIWPLTFCDVFACKVMILKQFQTSKTFLLPKNYSYPNKSYEEEAFDVYNWNPLQHQTRFYSAIIHYLWNDDYAKWLWSLFFVMIVNVSSNPKILIMTKYLKPKYVINEILKAIFQTRNLWWLFLFYIMYGKKNFFIGL